MFQSKGTSVELLLCPIYWAKGDSEESNNSFLPQEDTFLVRRFHMEYIEMTTLLSCSKYLFRGFNFLLTILLRF